MSGILPERNCFVKCVFCTVVYSDIHKWTLQFKMLQKESQFSLFTCPSGLTIAAQISVSVQFKSVFVWMQQMQKKN